ncbi:uncharacterized protein Z518_02874 [Rhinocladiella mackenziei CBS 650.93]|uniref:DUF302 domain-containing protein n=1 Tax=Rhinocladiella mackenziei CBS 650.93 TaxID=1442369 RepID=A0A0D2HCM8_9EURO|nr:uncharacterized protein Z518_02874 [Rhinocladiella mackenziei CBS 650.93]KIX08218.1 hypothetical protein Z518_02874 [Rhinocladiella mackenziei CBS 650.93]
MPVTTQIQPVSTDRLIYRSSISFDTAENRIRSSIQKSSTSGWYTSQNPNPNSRPMDRESFEASINSQIGPHGFMYFNEYNHGSWLPFYAPPTSAVTTPDGETKNLRCIRFILGNPLIAITMLRHDIDAGLSVPVEAYLVEEPETSVKIIWYQPSGLVAGYEGAKSELVDAARALDAKLEALIRWVLREEEDEGSFTEKL